MMRLQFAVIIVLMHFAVAALHGIAHGLLAVSAGSHAGLLAIATTVYIGPLVALAVLLRGRRVAGARILVTSMALALLYGLTFHYILRTPDHVAFAPAGTWGTVFRSTAAVIAVLEACGVATGVLLMVFPLPRDAGRADPAR